MVDVKVGQFMTTTGSSDVDVTDVGFEPKAIIFFLSTRNSSSDGHTGDLVMSVGFWEANSPTVNRCVSNALGDFDINTAQNAIRNDCCVEALFPTQSGGRDGCMTVKETLSNGFRMQVDNTFSTTRAVMYIALGGSDIVNSTIKSDAWPNATGQFSESDVSFTPNFGMVISGARTSYGLSGPNADAHLQWGFIDFDGNAMAWAEDHADGGLNQTVVRRSIRNSARLNMHVVAGSSGVSARVDHVSWDEGGYTWDMVEAGNAANALYEVLLLEIAAPGAKVGSFLGEDDTSTPIVVSDVGFKPTGVITFGGEMTERGDDASTTHRLGGVGAFTSPSEQRAIGYSSWETGGNADTSAHTRSNAMYTSYHPNGSERETMEVTSIDGSGFTCQMTDATVAQQNFIAYVAFPPALGAGGPSFFF